MKKFIQPDATSTLSPTKNFEAARAKNISPGYNPIMTVGHGNPKRGMEGGYSLGNYALPMEYRCENNVFSRTNKMHKPESNK